MKAQCDLVIAVIGQVFEFATATSSCILDFLEHFVFISVGKGVVSIEIVNTAILDSKSCCWNRELFFWFVF